MFHDCRLPPEAARAARASRSLTIFGSTGLSKNWRQAMRESTASKTSMVFRFFWGDEVQSSNGSRAFFAQHDGRCKADHDEHADCDRDEGRQMPPGHVPQHAADDRHDYRAGIADREHSGSDAVNVP